MLETRRAWLNKALALAPATLQAAQKARHELDESADYFTLRVDQLERQVADLYDAAPSRQSHAPATKRPFTLRTDAEKEVLQRCTDAIAQARAGKMITASASPAQTTPRLAGGGAAAPPPPRFGSN